ncbi:MAG TPA: hypothetical protein VJQ55_03995 [Candidatus Binatia bacterium]|nr:hypothetical protein [Candidatus Binatia bacterium]
MKFRNHPLMTCRGAPNWPPAWLGVEDNESFASDPGIVKHVITDNRDTKKCFLIVEQNGVGYVGLLQFDDSIVCNRISKILKKYTGRSIVEIGDSDLNLSS